MIGLAVLLLVAYLASAYASGAWWDIPASELLNQGASFAPAIAAGESWRLVSAIFLHGGLLHLFFNGIALLQIGRVLESRIGSARALIVFVLAGAWGFFASLLWQPEGISVGASGGIFGLLGAWSMLVLRDIDADQADLARTRRKLSVMLALLAAFGLGFLIPNVDHAAHLAGLLLGMLLGALVAHPKWRGLVFFASSLALAGGLALASLQLPEAWRVAYNETRDYTLRYQHFAEEDRAINQAMQAIGEASRRDALSDEEGLARLDRDLLPRLARLSTTLNDRNWQNPRIATDAKRWTAYAELKLAAVSALRDAIAGADPVEARADLERFERLMTEAVRLSHPAEPDRSGPQSAAPR